MADEEMKKLKRKKGSIKAELNIFSKFLNELQTKIIITKVENGDENICELETRFVQYENLIHQYNDIQDQIEAIIAETELEAQYSERESFCKSFYHEMVSAKNILNKYKLEQASSSSNESINRNSSHLNVKLPPIEVPKFSGDYENWLQFRETFESLIHTNISLSNIQKYHYLKASLLGNATEVITSLEFSADNYSIAWDLLCDRYNNTRLLIQNHVKAIFNIEVSVKQSSKLIRNIIDTMSKHLKALKQLKQPTDAWDTLIIYLITSKLDNATARDWEEYIAKKNSPTLDDLRSFLKAKADLLETLELKSADVPSKGYKGTPTKAFLANESNEVKNTSLNSNANINTNTGYSYSNCPFCKRNTHFIRNCPDFLKLSAHDRTERAKQLKLCINCLRLGHKNTVCRLSNCRKCNGRHNTLLHLTKPEQESENGAIASNSSSALTSYNTNAGDVLLSTALLQVLDKNNRAHTVRAILDSASQSSFITSDLCQRLDLATEDVAMAVTGINNASSEIKHKCDINIQSQHGPYRANITCFVIKNITGTLPSFPININKLNIPQNLVLADASFSKPGTVDILIGANLFWELITIGQVKLGRNLPILQKTVFGWIISGPLGKLNISNIQCSFNKNLDVQMQLAKFWELEECVPKVHLSKEEESCEKHFLDNTIRGKDGRFIVSIPFKDSLNKLGESKTQAEKRFLSIERKLARDANFREEYCKFMREYEELGHMRKISYKNNEEICYYMPHHGVLRENSLTTRLRVVFDCGAATTTGVSLNDLQMVGPVIQSDLVSILLRFRTHAFVVAADIAKMYRQVLIKSDQRSLQRIIWRYEPSQPLDIYELQTVTYGTSSAAFLAIRSLFQLGLDCQNSLPDIAEIIKYDFYVDDALFGANSVEETSRLALGVSNVLHNGGFELRKWHSNSNKIIQNITSCSSIAHDIMEIGTNDTTKTLGLAWSSCDDKLTYNIGMILKDSRVTKRIILSCVGQIFDPLGLLSPCVISIKILLQKLWLEKLAWDESVPTSIHTIWLKFKNEIPVLNNIKITRHAICKDANHIEMHCFSDASELAYGCCIYIRSTDAHGKIHVHLFCSKTKVAPLKVITVPRLELCGAVLSARLAKKIEQSLRIKFDEILFWTDSTIVLGWLKISPNLLKTFVAHRTSEIQDLTSDWNWRHVPTKHNPADILSRGMSPTDLKNCNFWWHGPQFLLECKSKWPDSKAMIENLPELKSRTLATKNRDATIIDFNRFSLLNRLKGSIAYLYRFIHNCQNPRNKITGTLSVNELNKAFLFLLKQSQRDSYPDEIALFSDGMSLTSKSKLFGLNPFLDEFGLLRVGGRLNNSDFHYNKKHPFIISAKHRLCVLIFKHEHIKMLHAGPQLLLSNIRESLWPVAGRNLAKSTVRQCVLCFKFNSKVISPLMGNLPQKRLEPGFPFQICGVDYAGPFNIKDKKGRGCKVIKCYLALFVCFSTKAVHLELVSDLTSASFILALKRFMSRRGKPTRIYSDNGTNFVGANTELRDLGKFLINEKGAISETCANEGIDWRFIPVSSPHFGGLWEAGVKSSKFHFKRVVGGSILTFEEMYTVFVQVEAVLNSRPISPLTSDPNDLLPLTPAHFLIGKPLTSTPEPSISHLPSGRLSRYQLLEQIRQNFWSRWSKEYVSEMQQRTKWRKNQDQVSEGTLVIVKEDNLPPMRWKMGRIVSLHPGKDGIARVASIQTSTGVIKRAFQKICPLPIESESFQGGGHVGNREDVTTL